MSETEAIALGVFFGALLRQVVPALFRRRAPLPEAVRVPAVPELAGTHLVFQPVVQPVEAGAAVRIVTVPQSGAAASGATVEQALSAARGASLRLLADREERGIRIRHVTWLDPVELGATPAAPDPIDLSRPAPPSP